MAGSNFPSFPSAFGDLPDVSSFYNDANYSPQRLLNKVRGKQTNEEYNAIDLTGNWQLSYFNSQLPTGSPARHSIWIDSDILTPYTAYRSIKVDASEVLARYEQPKFADDDGDPLQITLKFAIFLNTLNGFANFSRYDIRVVFTGAKEAEYKLIYYYNSITTGQNNSSVTPVSGIEIPAVILASGKFEEFILLLKYLRVPSEEVEKYAFRAYKQYYDRVKNSGNARAIYSFYNLVPRSYIEKILATEKQAATLLETHFDLLISGWVKQTKETAILTLMDLWVFPKIEGTPEGQAAVNATGLLSFLLKYGNDQNSPRWKLLYNRMNDFLGKPNFTEWMNRIYEYWNISQYATGKHPAFVKFEQYNNPGTISYANQRILGFNDDGTSVIFSGDIAGCVEVIQETKVSTVRGTVWVPTFSAHYHVFHPVATIKITPQGDVIDSEVKTEKLELRTPMPALYFKAINDQLNWQNLSTAGWLALDVATTFSGVGNIAKFRHLTKIAKAIKAASSISSATKASLNIYRAIKLTSGIVEVTSGSVNALLKLSDLDKTENGKALSNILSVLEVIAMVGDITGAMKLALNKNAKLIVKNYKEFDSGLEYLVKNGEISDPDKIRTLINIAELAEDKVRLLDTHVSAYLRNREILKKLNAVELLERFKTEINFKPISNFDVKNLYKNFIGKYPKLKATPDATGQLRQMNIASFKTTIVKGGTQVETITDLAHSGDELIYNNFIRPISEVDRSISPAITKKFRKAVNDIAGNSRRADSELKYIYHFLNSYIGKGDEFLIETSNIYMTCTSCQRELLMLKDYAENTLGKKMRIVVIGNEEIIDGKTLLKNL